MKATRVFLFALALSLASISPAQAAPEADRSPIQNLESISRELNLAPYLLESAPSPKKTVKIAVLDNGFKDYQKEIGRTLPANTVYHAGPVAPPTEQEAHGTVMAQIVAGLLTQDGKSTKIPFELHLFSAFGYSNLAAAVDAVVAGQFDVVLYAQVWEYGGNGDGAGFINKAVNKAAQGGVLWINAAGNFGNGLYRRTASRTEDDWASLPGPNNSVRIRCHKNNEKKCRLRVVLSWNDFKDDVEAGTEKDLDLVLTDDSLNVVQTSGLKQKLEPQDGEPGVSKYPREIIQADVEPGLYYARAKFRSRNFKMGDRLTVSASGDFIEVLDTTPGETLFNPADNAAVITVGASDSPASSSSRKLGKPELLFPSRIDLGDDQRFLGSSNSSAIAAAAAAVLRAHRPELTREEFLRVATGMALGSETGADPSSVRGKGLPLDLLRFYPTGAGCFEPVAFSAPWSHLEPLLRDGGRAVQTTSGIKIFVSVDPLQLISGLRRYQPNDIVVADPRGYTLQPRGADGRLGQAIEIAQVPLGQTICGETTEPPSTSTPSRAKRLRLPNPGRTSPRTR